MKRGALRRQINSVYTGTRCNQGVPCVHHLPCPSIRGVALFPVGCSLVKQKPARLHRGSWYPATCNRTKGATRNRFSRRLPQIKQLPGRMLLDSDLVLFFSALLYSPPPPVTVFSRDALLEFNAWRSKNTEFRNFTRSGNSLIALDLISRLPMLFIKLGDWWKVAKGKWLLAAMNLMISEAEGFVCGGRDLFGGSEMVLRGSVGDTKVFLLFCFPDDANLWSGTVRPTPDARRTRAHRSQSESRGAWYISWGTVNFKGRTDDFLYFS